MVTLEQFSEIVGGCDIATFEMIRAQAKRKLAVIIERFGDENGARLKDDYLMQLMMMYAVPNGGRRDRIEAAHLKQQGVKAGVPDICLAVPRGKYHGLYIEMKVGRNKTTDKQNEWLTNLSHYGYAVKVCYSCLAARAAIEKYLSLEGAT